MGSNSFGCISQKAWPSCSLKNLDRSSDGSEIKRQSLHTKCLGMWAY